MSPSILEIKILDRQTDGQQCDRIRVPFFFNETLNICFCKTMLKILRFSMWLDENVFFSGWSTLTVSKRFAL